MKSKKLMIVTTAYPYGKGETFLQPELTRISKYFDAIEIVPCSHPADTASRGVTHMVNMDYTTRRWGPARTLEVLGAFITALFHHPWGGDLLRIMRRRHRYENLKELARTLYRASMFENFLKRRMAGSGDDIGIIYFYWMTAEIMGAIAFKEKFQPSLKIISRAHRGDLHEEERAGGYIGLRDIIVRGIDEIFCISDNGRAYLEERYPFLKSRLHTERLGVDDPGYRNVQPRGEALSIVSCSFMVPEKRLHLVVDTIEYLLRTRPGCKIKWTHIGDGMLFDQLRASVSERIGTRAAVIFKGYRTYAEVMDIYRNEEFDVFMNVSDSEGIPVSLMEASAVGIPMIATDAGGNCEIVNAQNGALVALHPDIATIAAILLRFTDRPAAMAYRQQARIQWEEKFNAATNHDRFGRALVKLME